MDHMRLPPGQHRIEGFPRFGAHLHQPPPEVPVDPTIEIGGAVGQPFVLPVPRLAELPRRELTADFHCVAGWSATDLRWEGVAFETLYRSIIEPSLPPGARVSHVVFEGLDRYRSFVWLEDALAEDVLIAEHLGGMRLGLDHGAPVRLVSPSQYGFISVKHLCRIELHTSRPAESYHPAAVMQIGLQLVKPHQRARAWHEERHRYLPPWLVRPIYRRLVAPIRRLSAARTRDVSQS